MDDLDRLDCLDDQARDILRGLKDGSLFYVSASEFLAIRTLEKLKFVETNYKVGMLAVKITERGQKVIKEFDHRKAY